MKKKYLIFIVLSILAFSYLLFNEIENGPRNRLINDAKKIKIILEKTDKTNLSEEVKINNGFKLNDKKYNVSGKGVIFLEKNYSIFIEDNGMCAFKLPMDEDIMLQNEPCPIYKMFNGLKYKIVNKGSGLYKEDEEYIFKGNYQNNYVLYDNTFFQILKFTDDEMMLVSPENTFKDLKKLSKEEYNKTLLKDSFISFDKKTYYFKIIKQDFKVIGGNGEVTEPYILIRTNQTK